MKTSFTKVQKIVCLLLSIIHSIALDTSPQQSTIQDYAKRKIQQIELEVHDILDKVRIRRSFSDESSGLFITSDKINRTIILQSVVTWYVININGEEIAFAGTKEGEISRFDENLFSHAISDVETINEILGFEDMNGVWLIVNHNASEHFLRVYHYMNEILDKQQRINMPGETKSTTVKVKDKIYLFTVSNKDSDSFLNLYEWRETQFDLMTGLPLKGNYKTLAAREMNSDIFIGLSMDQDSKLNIFRFSESDGKLVLVQNIDGNFNVIKYFEVARDLYLIGSGGRKIILYWWNGDQFLEFQRIPNGLEPVVDISILKFFKDLVVIAIAKTSRVEYYFQDSSFDIIKHGNQYFENKLKSITVWKNKGEFYLLPVFENGLVGIFVLHITVPILPPVFKLNTLQNCSQHLDKLVDDVTNEINESNSKLHNIWIKDKVHQIPTVFVNGSVISNKTVEIGHISFGEDSESSGAQIISNFANQLSEKVKNLLNILRNAVMKSKKQEMNGNIEFVNGIEASTINVTELSKFDLNGINISKLSSILRIKGFQVIPYELKLNGMKATQVRTKFLNNNEINDYILLTKSWLMDGDIVFKDLSVNNMMVSSKSLNNVILRNMVIASASQNITSKKVFNLLSSKAITTRDNIKRVNTSRLKEFISKEAAVFNVQLNFSSDVIFENLNLHSINGFNLSHLIRDSIKYSGNEYIKGKKLFLEPVIVKDELFVSGCVNNMGLKNLLTLHEQQTIHQDIEFFNVSFKEIKTHSINDIDLCKEAIKKSGNFELNNSVHFLKPLEVFNINMKNDVSIDSMDLSDEMLHIVSAEEPIFNSSFTIGNVVILNNVEIQDSATSTLLFNLFNNVWRKTKSQNVSEGNFNILNADYLETGIVNGINLKEIALSKKYSIIDAAKIFEDVEAETLLFRNGKVLNKMDFTLDLLKSSKMEKLNILKVVNMFIKGNLNVPALNDLDILELMQVKKLQKCNGHKNFETIFLKNLTANNLNFDNVYNKSFAEYISNAVHHSSNKSIINKKFIYLSGKEIINEGLLNGRKFEKLLNSVVTLKTNQNISCNLKFPDPLKMKTLSVKNFNLINLNDVVFIDEIGKNIYNKVFNKIFANKAEFDIANRVNVSNWKNVFLKGQDNRITKMMTFQSDLKLSKFQVQSPATIDGVNLDNIIQVYGKIHVSALNLSVIHAKSIEVYGEINGCDLSDIGDLPMKNVLIKSKEYFTNLNIDGNLCIKGTLNGLPEDTLSDFISSIDYDDPTRQHNFSNIKVTHLQVLNGINNVTIDFLIKDAVIQHKFQDIKGIKIFQEKLTVNSTFINMLNVSILNKIHFPLLYSKHLSKKENQTISLKFINIKASDIFIDGTINGIELPKDVVLTHTKEKIYSPIFINETIILPDINVDGLIDGVNLSQLLDNKVSLRNPENISSTLIFSKDFNLKGNLELINFVNGINLSKVAKTKMHGQPVIEGNKRFLKKLFLHSDLKVLNFIDDFSKNLCRSNYSELFDDMVFFPEIKVSSLNVTSINNISVRNLSVHIHVVEGNMRDELDNLTDIINEMDDRFHILKSSIDPLSLYAFFELHQILNLGSTLRFLPVYESGIYGEKYELPTIGIIAWLNQNETCQNFKSLMMNVQSDGSWKELKKLNGRIFPFTLRRSQEEIKGFTLLVDRTKRCTLENQKPDILKMIFVDRNESRHTLISPPGSVMLDAKILEMENDLFLVIAYTSNADEDKIYVHKYDLFKDTWIEVQKFHTSGISSFDMVYIDDLDDNEIYLAVTGINDTPGIDLYSWNFEMVEFNLELHISKSVSSSALWVYTENDVFLLLAKENTKIFKNNVWIPVYTEPIEVYLLKDELKLSHEINVYGISSLETFNLSGETYVLAVSHHLQIIYVIQYQGYDGFQVIQEIHAPGVTNLSIFSNAGEILLAVASKTGHTKILKCIIKGGKIDQ